MDLARHLRSDSLYPGNCNVMGSVAFISFLLPGEKSIARRNSLRSSSGQERTSSQECESRTSASIIHDEIIWPKWPERELRNAGMSLKPSVSSMKAIFIQLVCVAKKDRFSFHQLNEVFK